jgi:hypothetical protein
MGLGAWLAAETERKRYAIEELRERQEVREIPDAEEEEIYEIFDEYDIPRSDVQPIVKALRKNEDMWVKVRKHLPLNTWMLTNYNLVHDGL